MPKTQIKQDKIANGIKLLLEKDSHLIIVCPTEKQFSTILTTIQDTFGLLEKWVKTGDNSQWERARKQEQYGKGKNFCFDMSKGMAIKSKDKYGVGYCDKDWYKKEYPSAHFVTATQLINGIKGIMIIRVISKDNKVVKEIVI